MRHVVGVLLLAALILAGAPGVGHAASHGCPDPTKLPPTPFRDLVSATHRSSVICAAWYDVARGTDHRRYHPLAAVRRDQMATFMARLLVVADVALPTRPAHPFSDVDGGVHGEAIEQVAALGVVEGTAGGRYHPHRRVTRGQMATFLVRLARLLEVEAADAPDVFDDDDDSAHEDDIDAAVSLRLVRGLPDGRFHPGRTVDREQMASLLSRMIRVLVTRGAMKDRPIPAFRQQITAVPPEMRTQMAGASWRRGCPVGIDDLALLRVTHWDYDAHPRRGHLIVRRSVAGDVAAAFRRIYRARFQIKQMLPIHTYPGGEPASLRDNNTSAFNCRAVTGGSGWSQHSYGTAIDINPRQNPYIKGTTVLPPSARPWIDRSPVTRGMIARDGPVVSAFAAIGWSWGGDYRSLKDYQHLSASGR